MYNILVVDDEKVYRDGVTRVIRQLGDYEVYNASNGQEALEIIKNNNIHGMILDISMPAMNGVELLGELYKLGINDIVTIVLSGHDEFEYAQKAMQYGAMDFVLKPVVPSELKEICNKMKERFEQRINKEEELRILKQQVEDSREMIHERFLMDETGYKERAEYLGIKYRGIYFRVALIQIESNANEIKYRKEEERQLFIKAVENTIKDTLEQNNLEGAYLFHHQTEDFVYFCNGGEDQKEDHKTIHMGLESIKAAVEAKVGVTLTIGLGNLAVGVENIAGSYNQAKTALRYKILLGPGNIFCFSDFEHNVSDVDLKVDTEEISLLVKTEQRKKILDQISTMFERIKNAKKKPDLSRVYMFCDKFATALISVLEDQGINISSFYSASQNPMMDIKAQKNIEDLEKWLKELLDAVLQLVIKNRSGKDISIVERVKQYLQEEYKKDINYVALGELFGYSANYLGQIFKQQTSLTINEYTRNVRIMNAKKLLKTSDLKIFEIADEVGFSDQQYFCSVFKKNVGVTPSEYREL
jgi:two-component system response regulator YesN